jgi:hypothetical protein
MKLGKQMREPFRWLTDPLSIGGSKASPAVRTMVEQLSKHSTTGFPTEFAYKHGQPQGTFVESVPARLKSIGSKFIPFSLQGNSVMFAFPKSSFTERTAIMELGNAIRGTKGLGGDRALVNDILRMAKLNNLDVLKIASQVRRQTGDPRGMMTAFIENEKQQRALARQRGN